MKLSASVPSIASESANAAGHIWPVLTWAMGTLWTKLFRASPTITSEQDLERYIEQCVKLRTSQLQAQLEEHQRLSQTDCLTRLPNRRGFLIAAEMELARIRRNGRSACLVIGDIDFFKAINDQFGHIEGDRVLQSIARTLRANLRGSDLVARWGGEEFVVLLPETEPCCAARAVEKCRVAIQGLTHLPSSSGTLSMSFGISTIGGDACLDAALTRADRALYAAKQTGRNRMILAD